MACYDVLSSGVLTPNALALRTRLLCLSQSALKQIRGDDKTFAGESRSCTDIDANGSGPIATAFKSGKEVTVTDVSTLKRATLAKVASCVA